MTLSGNEYTLLHNEIINDPLAMGYSGQTAAQMTVLMNAAGSASYDPPIPVVSDTPMMMRADEILDVISSIDGMVERNNATGAGLAEMLNWLDTSDDLWAICGRHCFTAAGLINIAGVDHRAMIDYMAGVEINVGSPPAAYMLISEPAMETVMALGMVDMSRARELVSRSVTEADITEAMS
jgi:hypothetical protein